MLIMRRTYSLFSLLFVLIGLLCSGCSSRDAGYPLPQPKGSVLHLAVATPRSIVLRGLESEDPMLRIASLRFVFYSADKSVVSQVRELAVSSSTDLSDLALALPEGDYKLVVIANPTAKLIAKTAVGSPLAQLTGYDRFYLDGLATQGSQLTVSLLNEQGPISVSASDFASSTPKIRVLLEASLTRVLVYGEPRLAGGAKRGEAPAGYVVSPQAVYTAPLRPLGLLRTGGNEVAGDGSLAEDRYSSSRMCEAWKDAAPKKLTELLTYYSQDRLTTREGGEEIYQAGLLPNE